MTPEEKAKRYNEALERAKIAYKDEDRHLKATLDRIFPELKEDKGEKIRKAIINVIKSLKEQQCHHIYGVMYDEMIAWLEKQGRHANFRNKIRIGDKVTRNEDGVLVNLSQLNRVAKKNEKQGEQKQDPCDNCKDVMLNCHNFPCVKKRAFKQGKSVLEAINEEKVDNANKVGPKDYSSIDPHFGKPIDKVEPKFKVGDWVTDGYLHCKISDVLDDRYIVDTKFAKRSAITFNRENNYHLWTIEDAKDGDVLACKDELILFKSYDNKNLCYYCWYNGQTNIYFPKDTHTSRPRLDIIVPATKEQRDTLMKAMTDAGYTFDFEKKELKKIEDEKEIPFGAKDSELQEATYYIPKGFHAEIDDDKVVIKKGEKPIWSEMDEEILQWVVSDVKRLENDCKKANAISDKELTWLKSLKGRVGCEANCTTTKEWSEEDKTALGDALWCCKQAASIAKNENDMGNIWYAEKWLKSLERRIHPKNDYNPYKEVVESIVEMCQRYDRMDLGSLQDFYDNVKVKCKEAKEFDSLHTQSTKMTK